MKTPRDLGSQDLIKALATLGNQPTRQTGSHVRLTSTVRGEQHITIPAHDPLKVGTLNAILRDVAEQTGMSRENLLKPLF